MLCMTHMISCLNTSRYGYLGFPTQNINIRPCHTELVLGVQHSVGHNKMKEHVCGIIATNSSFVHLFFIHSCNIVCRHLGELRQVEERHTRDIAWWQRSLSQAMSQIQELTSELERQEKHREQLAGKIGSMLQAQYQQAATLIWEPSTDASANVSYIGALRWLSYQAYMLGSGQLYISLLSSL
jgi:hypothetical protein